MSSQTVNVRHSTPESEDGPGAKGPAWIDQHEAVDICREVYGGTLTMRAAGRLRQHPKEEDDAYADRLGEAVLFNAFRRTVKGLTGLVFRKAPIISEDVPEAIEPHLENVDLAGRHLFRFAKDLFKAKTTDGHAHIFVDWHGPEGATSAQEEDAAGARPFWTLIEKMQVIRFWTENRDGEKVLISFAWIQNETTRDGDFKTKAIQRVRQYDLVAGEDPDTERVQYRSWTREDDSGDWVPEIVDAYLGTRMVRIPLVTDYADRSGFMTSEPPLLDLALENIEHWRVRSERSQSLGIASIPIFTVIGDLKKEDIITFVAGAALGLLLPKGSTAAFTETSGNALESSRDELRDIEQRMAALGLSVLVRRPSQPQTAEAEKLNRSEQDSELGDSAEGTETALTEAMALTAMWMGLTEGGGSVGLNKDFNLKGLTPQMLNVLSGMVGEKITLSTLWDMMEEGELLPATFNAEREVDELAKAGEAELRAAIELARTAGPPAKEDDDPEGAGSAAA